MDQLSSSSNSNSNSNSSPSNQKGNKLTGFATKMFHNLKSTMGFVPALTMTALTTIACSPSIPQDIMNMGYAVGGAAAMSSRSVSPPIPIRRFTEYFSDDSVEENNDNESISSIDEDSNPILKERKRVNYDETCLANMEDDREEFDAQLRKMKRNNRYIPYQNQTSVAMNINQLFNDRRVVIQMVIGYTQSGKTGCMVELIDQMMSNVDNPISSENIFIITGLSSCAWIDQTRYRIPTCMKDNIFHNGDLKKFKEAVAGKQNILVIVDEAQMACKEKQTMSRIFKDLNWKIDFMMENDIKLVQFSATPDGLIFALNGPKWPKEHYKITIMAPGNGYYGAKHMKSRGQLKQIKEIYGRDRDGQWISPTVKEECLANIVEILHDQLSFSTPRYLIVRIRGGISEDKYHENFLEAIESLSHEQQEQFDEVRRRYDQRGDVVNISKLLFETPEKHTIIFIKEKMKCAQTLEYIEVDEKTGKTTTRNVKHNIGVVVERKRNGDKNKQNDSFTIQGLLGRLCGYEEHNCICYTNLKSVEKYDELFDSNFSIDVLKRVSWNSNTTHGKGENRGTSSFPNVNDECVTNSGEEEADESSIATPEYDLHWMMATKDSFKDELKKLRETRPEITIKTFKNPFIKAEAHKVPEPNNHVWQGHYRGWKVLKFMNGKLYECDENLIPRAELSTGCGITQTNQRQCVCYNEENQLGVCVVKLLN